jgi:tripartite-type tricarboxylate transporter receptor subunit TctC
MGATTMIGLRRLALAGLAAVAWLGHSAATLAQSYPDRPIQLIIPFPPGGAADVLGRLVAKEIEPKLGQAVLVVNKAGAGTIIGAQAVATSKPDGYTIFMSSNTTFSMNPAVQQSLPYDAVKDFEPIGMVANLTLALIVNPLTPYQNLKSLIDAAKAAPDTINHATFGNATSSHFAAEMLKDAAGIKMTHIPYKGSAPAMTDLIGGQVPVSFDTMTASIPQAKAGKIRILAVTTAKRSDLMPDVPTLAESGYPGFDLGVWIAMVAPTGLPDDVRTKLQRTLAEISASTEFQAKLLANGAEPAYRLIPDWAGFVTADMARYKAIAVKAAIKAD